MRVLVTGGAGFIGGHSCRLLLERGHEVTAADDLSSGRRENMPAGAALHVVDVRSAELAQLIERFRPDAVLHLAAQMDVRKSVADPLFDASVNVLGTLNALEASRRAGARRFVLASSGGAIYGEQETFPATESHPRRPASPYGVSKLCGEEYLELYARAHGISALSLRYANVYGPAQNPHGEAGVVAIFLQRLLSGSEPLINGDGEQTRDFVYVEDVARINCAAVESQVPGAINVGTGRETSVNEIARICAQYAGWTRPIRHGPEKPGEQRRSVIDAGAAREQLGWEPGFDLERGLRQTAEWFRAELARSRQPLSR
jgi:UDP-glucose 4-epimerase